MLWVELIMFFQPERNKNRVRTGKVKYEIFSGAGKPGQVITFLLQSSRITVELSRKRFLLKYDVRDPCDLSAFPGINVQCIRSEKAFASKICME